VQARLAEEEEKSRQVTLQAEESAQLEQLRLDSEQAEVNHFSSYTSILDDI